MKIIKAAIKFNDKVYIGFDHGECFKQMQKQDVKGYDNSGQGFITDTGVFVDRIKACKIARKAKQIAYDTPHECLISEDLHLYWLNEQEKKIFELQTILNEIENYIKSLQEYCEIEEMKDNKPVTFYSLALLQDILDRIEELENKEDK